MWSLLCLPCPALTMAQAPARVSLCLSRSDRFKCTASERMLSGGDTHTHPSEQAWSSLGFEPVLPPLCSSAVL